MKAVSKKSSNVKNKLAGRVAVITSQGEMERFDLMDVSLSSRDAATCAKSFISLTATLQKVSFTVAANNIDRLKNQLWVGIECTINTELFNDYLPEFANEVVAVLGAGNYVFDFTGAVAAAHKLSRHNFQCFVDSAARLYSANDEVINAGEAA